MAPSAGDDDANATNAPTPAISNKRRSRPYVHPYGRSRGDDDDDDDDDDSCSVSACSSLGVGTLVPLPPQQPQKQRDLSQPSPSSQENTPTSSNKAVVGSRLAGLLPAMPSTSSSLSLNALHNHDERSLSPLLGASVSDHHNDDVISVLSGHSASAHSAAAARSAARSASPASSSASPGPLFLPTTIGGNFPATGANPFRRHDGLEPIRQQRHHGSASSLLGRSVGCDAVGECDDDAVSHISHDASTLLGGISVMDHSEVGGGGSSPVRRSTRRFNGADSVDTGTTGNSKSRRGRKKMRNPFRRRKKFKGSEGDSVSAFSGTGSHMLSDVSDLGSIATARSGRSYMSVSTMGSASSRLSAFAKKMKPRRIGKTKKKTDQEPVFPSWGAPKEGRAPTTPERLPAEMIATIPDPPTTPCSDPLTPFRRGSPRKKVKDSPPHSLNMTLPTVETYEEDEETGSTYSSVVSSLSAGGASNSTPQRMDRRSCNRGYPQQGRRRKKDGAAVDEFPPVYFETKRRLPLLTLEESFDEDEEFGKRSVTDAGTIGEARDTGRTYMLLDDSNIPVGLTGRTSTQELMSRLSISTELGNSALNQLRRQYGASYEHRMIPIDGGGTPRYSNIPHITVFDAISIPDYESYVQDAVDLFRKRLGITDEMFKEISCTV